MLERFRLLAGEGEHLLHARRVGNVAGHLVLLTGADLLLDLLADSLEIQPHLLKNIHGNSLAQLDEAQQEMLGANVVVIEAVSLLAREG